MHIHRISPDRLVFDTENVSTMRYFLLPIFRPGEMQSIYFIERESQDGWRYYSIARMGANASKLAGGTSRILYQPSGRFLPPPGGHSDGSGASCIALNRLSHETTTMRTTGLVLISPVALSLFI